MRTRRQFLTALAAILSAPGPVTAGEGASGRWVCTNPDCDPYIYDPAAGDPDYGALSGRPVPPGTAFAALPEDWVCPVCGWEKETFVPL
ncbi:MAG: rubredoxin [Defluviicoccus sp.]|nr:rubredoxin [Defluviicoccus sp.]MDG4610047.1 rubredoxin [Defluviicoccus sp.]